VLTEAEYGKAKRDLLFRSRGGEYFGFGPGVTVSLLEEDRDLITLPRSYWWEELRSKDVEDRMSRGERVDFVFNPGEDKDRFKQLSDAQDRAIAEFFSKMGRQESPFKHGIFCAECGQGKTVCACKMMAKLKRTTAVVVDKDFLIRQWRERLERFLGLGKDDVGEVRQSKSRIDGCKVVLCMAQTLYSRGRNEKLENFAGLLIVDEVHKFGAPLFQTVVPRFSASVRIGLTATPRRSDGLQGIFERHMGKVLTVMDTVRVVDCKVYALAVPMVVPSNYYMPRSGDKVYMSRLINWLAKNRKRNAILLRVLCRALEKGRKVIALSDRLEQVHLLADEVERRMPQYRVLRYVGATKKKDQAKAHEADLLIGTYGMAKDALDLPALDTLVFLTPKADVEQPVGRILRGCAGKKDPMVVDPIDAISDVGGREVKNDILGRFWGKRARLYAAKGFEIISHGGG